MGSTLARGSSPHTRGAPDGGARERRRLGIIPAYAGSTRVANPPGAFFEDHPRIRGEHRKIQSPIKLMMGSSPHTRGALRRRNITHQARRIIPAYAGSTFSSCLIGLRPRDHPRIRGEHLRFLYSQILLRGSSPHTRGALTFTITFTTSAGIIPAYAGSTGTLGREPAARGDHPRIRGEHLPS